MLDLTVLYPPLLEFLIISTALLMAVNLNTLIKQFRGIKNVTWAALLMIFLLGLIVRLYIIPHTHQVYFDEFDHMNIAENILHSNTFCSCSYGSIQECKSCNPMPWPPGYHTFLSFSLGLFGDSEATAFNTTAVIGSLSIILVFMLVFLLYNDCDIALLSSFVFSLIPVFLKYSGTITVEVFSLFCVLLSILVLEVYLKTKKYLAFILLLTVLLYTIQVRIENILLLPPISFYIFAREGIKEVFNWKYIAAILAFLLLTTPLIQLITYALNYPAPGYAAPLSLKLYYLQKQFIPNLLFFFNLQYTPIVFSLICVVGAVELCLVDSKRFIFCLSYLLLFLAVYSTSPGTLTFETDNIRYILVLYVPMFIFFASGIKLILEGVHINKSLLLLLLAACYLISLIPTQTFIFSKSNLDGEYRFILSMDDRLPSGIYVISYEPPAIISTIHKPSISPEVFMRNLNSFKSENVILFKDYWWYNPRYRDDSAEIESELLKHYNFSLIEKSCEGYAFYNLTPS